MPAPTRLLPRVGGRVRVLHFGGSAELGQITGLAEKGRRLEVLSDAGERFEFVLNPATARFASLGPGHGPRLELLPEGYGA